MIGTELDYQLLELTNQFRFNPSAFVDFVQQIYAMETDEYQKNYYGTLLSKMDAY